MFVFESSSAWKFGVEMLFEPGAKMQGVGASTQECGAEMRKSWAVMQSFGIVVPQRPASRLWA